MSEINVRAADFSTGDNRLVRGILVPYSTAGAEPRFAAGAFTRSIAERGGKVRLFAEGHSRPVGKVVELVDTPAGVSAVFDIDPGPTGDAVLASFRSGKAQLSARVRPMAERTEGTTVIRSEAALIDARVAFEMTPSTRMPVISRSVAERRLRLLELES